MTVVLDEQTDTVVLEGLDFEVPYMKGEHVAAFFVKCRGCEINAGNLCGDHLAEVRRRLERASLVGVVVCGDCHRVSDSFDGTYQVTPL